MSNFVFFGTPYVASETLSHLIEAGFTPSLVVTNPDARRGRGMELHPSPVKVLAEEYNIPVLTPEKLDEDTQKEILLGNPEYAIVVAYGKIFPEELINAFPRGVLNVHYSLLPKYRGATPTEAALLHGDAVTGVTVQKMVKELDAGDVIAQREIPIDPLETTLELRPRLITLGAELLVETLPKYLDGSITPIAQDHSKATKCGKFTKSDGLLDLDAPAIENWNKYRAYKEWPGTYFFKGDKRVKITDATLTPNGVFQILKVIPEGKKEVDYATFQT
ncbi:methionyl-tRNA formyltransferase [Candidatus Kaiserbacteria bacterium]|nr:methionyl-tRNA formyltransferase [Candidatus Kaiserbacteria bacterium]